MTNAAMGSFTRAVIWLQLRFEDPATEREYRHDHQVRTAKFTANAIAFSAFLWGAFGLWDSAKNLHAVEITRFRFMVAIPTLLAVFCLTFTPVFRRWPNAFLLCFAATASFLAIKQLLDYGEGNPFYLSSGTAALNFCLILVFGIGFFHISVGR